MSKDSRTPHDITGRLRSIDALRGLAALGVLFCHIKHHADQQKLNLRFIIALPLDYGEIWVSLFIVISGFCIHLNTARQLGKGLAIRSDWSNFWRRRAYRLYPPYLAAIVFGLIAFYFSGPNLIRGWKKIDYAFWDLGAHLLMIHNLSPSYWDGLGNSSLWSLGMEEQLYGLYFFYLVLRRRLRSSQILFLALLLSSFWIIAARMMFPKTLGHAPMEIGAWHVWPFSWWFNWVLGAVAAETYVGVAKLPKWCFRGDLAMLLGALGILSSHRILGRTGESHFVARLLGDGSYKFAFDFATTISPLLFPLASFLLLNSWVRSETQGHCLCWWKRHMAKVGLISYSLYLTHLPVLYLAETVTAFGDGPHSILLRYMMFSPLCVIFAWCFFQAVERRFLRPTLRGLSARMTPDVPLRNLNDFKN